MKRILFYLSLYRDQIQLGVFFVLFFGAIFIPSISFFFSKDKGVNGFLCLFYACIPAAYLGIIALFNEREVKNINDQRWKSKVETEINE